MKNITLKINGMHCGGCALIVQSLIGRADGVKTVCVSFEEGEARVLYENNFVGIPKLIEIIEKAGYKVIDGLKQNGVN